MGLHHSARNPGVTGFIRPDESKHPKVAEVANVKGGAEEHAPDNEGASGYVRISGSLAVNNWSRGGLTSQRPRTHRARGSFLHGKVSLTLKDFLPLPDLLHTVAQ